MARSKFFQVWISVKDNFSGLEQPTHGAQNIDRKHWRNGSRPEHILRDDFGWSDLFPTLRISQEIFNAEPDQKWTRSRSARFGDLSGLKLTLRQTTIVVEWRHSNHHKLAPNPLIVWRHFLCPLFVCQHKLEYLTKLKIALENSLLIYICLITIIICYFKLLSNSNHLLGFWDKSQNVWYQKSHSNL